METRLRSAGIWISGSHILLETLTDREVWGIPGGSVESGESIEQACVREYREETGISLKCSRLAIIHENFWNDSGQNIREYGFYFIVVPVIDYGEKPHIVSLEKHMHFRWHALSELSRIHFVPHALQSYLHCLPDDTQFVSTGNVSE
jgi:8-oxo-dGTP pyrophosphatase MutT (NUDIX family)